MLNVMKTPAFLSCLAALLIGCSIASDSVSTAGKTAAGGIKFAGRTAASATGGATKTATGAVGTVGDVLQSSVKAASGVVNATSDAVVGVVKAPFVVFKERKTGKRKEVQWENGLTLDQALEKSEVVASADTVRVRRGERVLKGRPDLKLKAGDVIEFKSSVGDAKVARAGDL